MSKKIPASFNDLITKPVLAYLAVTLANHTPQVTPVWFMLEPDDRISFNTAEERLKAKALAKNPYAAILIMDPTSHARYISVRGPVTTDEANGRAHINALSQKYTGSPVYTYGPPTEKRIKYTLTIEHLLTQG